MRKVRFEWDEEKDMENQAKHGVSFTTAQHAFLDPHRLIAEDIAHSSPLGSHTGAMSSAYTVQAIGEKGERFMKTTTKYTEEPMGDLRIVKDFLPTPDQLVLREDNVKVTIALKKSSIDTRR